MSDLRAVLDEAEPRPSEAAKAADKKNYAERLSRALATNFAQALRAPFPGITPDPDGGRQEAPARTSKGVKKLDVNYSTPELGLGLGVSIKTLNYRDAATKRYTKNYTRVDNELRAEAMDYHVRQPYAVLVAVLFLPVDSADDGGAGSPSSFGQAVRLFRNRAGRTRPSDEPELFERVFVALYEHSGPERGSVRCFDVTLPPPRLGKPEIPPAISLDDLIGEIRGAYDVRNHPPFEWAPDR